MKPTHLYLALDVGTEAIKAVVFKSENNKIEIVDNQLVYLDVSAGFNGKELRLDVVKKEILDILKGARNRNKIDEGKIYLSLPPDILKAKIKRIGLKREKKDRKIDRKEETEIFQYIASALKTKAAEDYSREAGILPNDLTFAEIQILETSIDGYIVEHVESFKGEGLEFLALVTFLPTIYFEEFNKFFHSLGFKDLKISHEIQNITKLVQKDQSGVFIDIGGEITLITLIKKGKIESFYELKSGGRVFSLALSQYLGMNIHEARILKEKYSDKLLSEETQRTIEEIFSPYIRYWFENLENALRMIQTPLPSDIFIFGGGSRLPEVQKVLNNGGWGDIPFIDPPKISFISTKDLKTINFRTKEIDGPISISVLLICLNYAGN